jgi:Mg2+ and Co2+ transporter CorA
MNFLFLTANLETPTQAFWIGVGTMVFSVVIQFYFFKRRGWL